MASMTDKPRAQVGGVSWRFRRRRAGSTAMASSAAVRLCVCCLLLLLPSGCWVTQAISVLLEQSIGSDSLWTSSAAAAVPTGTLTVKHLHASHDGACALACAGAGEVGDVRCRRNMLELEIALDSEGVAAKDARIFGAELEMLIPKHLASTANEPGWQLSTPEGNLQVEYSTTR